MNFCVYMGTFNPIHKVHINVAQYALDCYGFDKVIFIPAYIPPHKIIDKQMAAHRYNMVKLAIEDNDKFEISDIEYKREGNSYTYLTVLELQKLYNTQDKINLLIGTDAFRQIETWYETEKLKEIVHFIVFQRGENIDIEYLKSRGYDFEIASMKYIDVSSTQIRNDLKTEVSIDEIELDKVTEYIKKHGLYQMA